MNAFHRSFVTACIAASSLPALAVGVQIQINGVVDYNVIGGSLAGTPSGSPVAMSFLVDSNVFVDSASFPTRGYTIDLASFVMTVDGNPINMDDPQPGGDAYFVLRDNDPAIDGFFITQGGVDLPFPTSVHIPGLAPSHDLDFLYTFANGTTLSSLNIVDAYGTYAPPNVSVYQWTLGRFGNPGAEFIPGSITIAAVPEPASLVLMGLGGLVVLARVRRRAGSARVV